MSTANMHALRVRIENTGRGCVTLRNLRLDIPPGEPHRLIETITIGVGDSITVPIHHAGALMINEADGDPTPTRSSDDD